MTEQYQVLLYTPLLLSFGLTQVLRVNTPSETTQ